MARKLRNANTEREDEDDGPQLDETARANAKDRKEYLLARIGEITTLERDIAFAMSTVKPMRKTMGNQYRLIKNNLGFDRAYVEQVRRVLDLEDEKRDLALCPARALRCRVSPR